jgi:hypothetical protein
MKNLFSFNWIAQEEDLSLLSDLTENDTCAASHLFHEGKDFLQRLQLFQVFDVKLGKIVEVVSQPWVAGRCRLLEGGSQRGCNDTKNRYRQHDLPKHEAVRTLWILRVAAFELVLMPKFLPRSLQISARFLGVLNQFVNALMYKGLLVLKCGRQRST